MIRYDIDVGATRRHTFSVELRIDRPGAEQRLSLPAWIPGSYLVREFARHLSALSAEQGGAALPLEQLDKATWLARCAAGIALVVRYQVYAFDTSVRAAFLDSSRGFFNGTGVCLRAEGLEGSPHALALSGLPAGWDVATTLDPRPGAGANEFIAADYDTLVDHPVELGNFWRGAFDAAGVRHEFVVAGAWPDFDGERLLADTRRICGAEIGFWHGSGRAPFDRYLFMLNAVEDGRGGLEHRASTALVAPRRDLPRSAGADAAKAAKAATARPETSDGYVGVLGLIAHEYFHAWNVKRLKPRDFARLDYTQENYTGLLWFFEGFTSYYDDLFVLRSGLIDAPRYLKLLATTIAAVQASPGRLVQSVAA
ncbi:MAG: peptidase M61, partial [Pseudomonadota bacterium]|nr:peptidase M61 [Pseudomonadota bacterium]